MKLVRLFCLGGALSVVGVGSIEAQWIPTGGPIEGWTSSLAVDVGAVGDTILYAGTWGGWVFQSSNSGADWEQIDGGTWWAIPQDTGFTRRDIHHLATCGNLTGGTSLFAVNDRGNLFRSVNADTHWVPIDISRGPHGVTALLVDNATIFAGTDSGSLVSTNAGTTWTSFSNALTPYRVFAFVAVPNDSSDACILAGTNGGVFCTTDEGTTWTSVNSEMRDFYRMVCGRSPSGEASLFAFDGTLGRVFRSLDAGMNWEKMSALPYTSPEVRCMAAHDTLLYVGTQAYGIFYSVDGGANWIESLGGIGRRWVRAIAVGADHLFAGVDSDIRDPSSVWRCPLSALPASVGRFSPGLPNRYSLNQNYPNPFNPSTTIQYSLAQRTPATLTIFNCLGQAVETLLDGEQEPGHHEARFDGSRLASGVYFYRLTAGEYVQSRKMILQR